MPKKVEVTVQKLGLEEIKKYINDNCEYQSYGFYTVKTPLKVWKKTYTDRNYNDVLTALLIPAGETIYANLHSLTFDENISFRKMRASGAQVIKQNVIYGYRYHSNNGCTYNVGGNSHTEIELKYKEIQKSISDRDNSFQYKTGKYVVPEFEFSLKDKQCASGIHFFVNMTDALIY